MSKYRILSFSLIVIIVINLVAGTALAAPTKPANLKFADLSISLIKGEKIDLKTKLSSTVKVQSLFSTSNAKIVSVTSAGIVTGIAPGKATVTASVSQKGYSGRASIIVQVVAPATSGSKATVSAKPVTYTDKALLDSDIRKGLQALFKKDYSKLTAEEIVQRDKLMNINRQQLLVGLQAIVIKGAPSWSTSMVQDFAVHNLEDNIKDIGVLFSSAGTDQASQKAALEMLKAFKSDKALQVFGNLIMSSPDANLRYSLAYLISKYEGNSEALSILINVTFKETDDKAWGNEAASLISVAGTDPKLINTVILVYGQFSDTQKNRFSGLFGYNDPARAELFKVWETALNGNLESTVEELRNSSSILLNELKKFPHFNN